MTSPALTPIETHYNGYLFRSRLEARWAKFFDAAGLTWDYEREGYALPSGWYLPDFWMPYVRDKPQNVAYPAGNPPYAGYWIEIKPGPPTTAAIIRGTELAIATKHCVWLIGGPPGDGAFAVWKMHYNGTFVREMPQTSLLYAFERCLPLGKLGVGGGLMYLNEDADFCTGPEALRAFSVAKSARFEKGA